MKHFLLGSMVAGLLAASCGEAPEESGWTRVGVDALEGPQLAQRTKALAARDALAQRLLGRVRAEVQASGPAGAVHVCREAAPELTAAIAEETGVRIGRTSFKLRNPKNSAPAWTGALLEDHPEEERLALGPDGLLGVTLPIHVQGACLACHGAPDELGPGVADALAEKYPDDRATGFAADDLRGWFWVEVPAGG